MTLITMKAFDNYFPLVLFVLHLRRLDKFSLAVLGVKHLESSRLKLLSCVLKRHIKTNMSELESLSKRV